MTWEETLEANAPPHQLPLISGGTRSSRAPYLGSTQPCLGRAAHLLPFCAPSLFPASAFWKDPLRVETFPLCSEKQLLHGPYSEHRIHSLDPACFLG